MADAKVFEVSFKGEFPKSKSIELEMHWVAWVVVGLVLLFLIVGVPSLVAGAERFQVLTSGGPQIDDRAGHGAYGGRSVEGLKRKRQGFLNTRDGGPNVGGMSQELVDYYAGAIAQPGDDADPSADGAAQPASGQERMSAHSDAQLAKRLQGM